MSLNDVFFMNEALEEAKKAIDIGEVPIGAVVVHNGEIISRAHNESITRNDPTAHAEILALRRAGKYLQNYRLSGTRLYCTIEPCPMCVGASIWARVEKIVFGTKDEKAGSCGTVFSLHNSKDLNHEIKIKRGILETECKEIIQNFFKNKR